MELGPGDLVIISASAIPGNEKTISRVVDELYRKGVDVLYNRSDMLHVSGHACQEEQKILHALVASASTTSAAGSRPTRRTT